jgi:hypothetical protein
MWIEKLGDFSVSANPLSLHSRSLSAAFAKSNKPRSSSLSRVGSPNPLSIRSAPTPEPHSDRGNGI